jgi:hypothetical protein
MSRLRSLGDGDNADQDFRAKSLSLVTSFLDCA